MNRTFEERKPSKAYAKSEENKAIIKALNMYGRVPEQWELLKEIEKLKEENKQLKEELEKKNKKYWQQKCFYYSSILYSLEEWAKSYLYMLNGITDKDIYEKQQLDDFADLMDKIQELKEKYK